MKKVLRNITYDTDTATVVKKKTFKEFGDPTGYEETIYVTESNKYFLYVNGGSESIHPVEKIEALSEKRAKEMLGK